MGAQYFPPAGLAAGLLRSPRVLILSREYPNSSGLLDGAACRGFACDLAARHGIKATAVLLVFTCVLLSILRRDFLAVTLRSVRIGPSHITAIGASPHFGINTGRITAIYSFALPLALLAFVLGPSEQLRQFVAGSFDARRAGRVAVTACGLILVMSIQRCGCGHRRGSWFEADVNGKKAARKVFDDAALSRSGYYVFVPNVDGRSGAGVLVYKGT